MKRVLLKVWCLPKELTEEQLKELFRSLLEAAKDVPNTGVFNENDITILFPADRMEWGLGDDIIAEISDVPVGLGFVGKKRLAGRIGRTLTVRFPSSFVKCKVMEETVEVWTSRD